jgi:hypothetical protein
VGYVLHAAAGKEGREEEREARTELFGDHLRQGVESCLFIIGKFSFNNDIV